MPEIHARTTFRYLSWLFRRAGSSDSTSTSSTAAATAENGTDDQPPPPPFQAAASDYPSSSSDPESEDEDEDESAPAYANHCPVPGEEELDRLRDLALGGRDYAESDHLAPGSPTAALRATAAAFTSRPNASNNENSDPSHPRRSKLRSAPAPAAAAAAAEEQRGGAGTLNGGGERKVEATENGARPLETGNGSASGKLFGTSSTAAAAATAARTVPPGSSPATAATPPPRFQFGVQPQQQAGVSGRGASSLHRAQGRGAAGRGSKTTRVGAGRASGASAGRGPRGGFAGKEASAPNTPRSPADMMDVSESPLTPVFGSTNSPDFVFQAGQPRASTPQQQPSSTPPPAYSAMPLPGAASPAASPGVPPLPQAFVFGSPAAPSAASAPSGVKPIPSPAGGRLFSVGSSPSSRPTAAPQARPAAVPPSRPPSFSFGANPGVGGVPVPSAVDDTGTPGVGIGIKFATGTVPNAAHGRKGQRGRPGAAAAAASGAFSRSSHTPPPPPKRDWDYSNRGGGRGAVELNGGLNGELGQAAASESTAARPTALRSPLAAAGGFFASIFSPRRKAAATAAAASCAAPQQQPGTGNFASCLDDASTGFSTRAGAGEEAPSQDTPQGAAPAYRPLRDDLMPPSMWPTPEGGRVGASSAVPPEQSPASAASSLSAPPSPTSSTSSLSITGGVSPCSSAYFTPEGAARRASLAPPHAGSGRRSSAAKSAVRNLSGAARGVAAETTAGTGNGKEEQEQHPSSGSTPASAGAAAGVPGQSTCSADDGPPPFAFTFGSPTVPTTGVVGGTGPPARPARPPRFAFGAGRQGVQEGQEGGASTGGSFSAQAFMQQQRGNQRKLGEFEVSCGTRGFSRGKTGSAAANACTCPFACTSSLQVFIGVFLRAGTVQEVFLFHASRIKHSPTPSPYNVW